MIVAIQPDDYTDRQTPDRADASSPRWAALLQEAGHGVRWVDVYRPDIVEQVRGCDGVMWRWGHFDGMGRIARRLLPVLAGQLGILCYPDENTCWHYDDKIAQRYLLEAAGVPMPRTWVFFRKDAAMQWVSAAAFPLVLKLYSGAGACNVCLVRDYNTAAGWINRLFGPGIYDIQRCQDSVSESDASCWPDGCSSSPWGWRLRVRAAVKAVVRGRPLGLSPEAKRALLPSGQEWHRGYVYFQEFLPDNSFDTRIAVIGNRAFGFRRFNRPDDFRASGSGRIDHDPESIDERMIRLAFSVARQLGTQSVAIDGLYRDGQCVVGEISYTYASWAVHDCPGHWELEGDATSGELRWLAGHMWPEEAQVVDFLSRLHERYR